MDIKIFGYKWLNETFFFIYQHGPVRFNFIKNGLPGITSKQLSIALMILIDEKLIVKNESKQSTIPTFYDTTSRGDELIKLLIKIRRL